MIKNVSFFTILCVIVISTILTAKPLSADHSLDNTLVFGVLPSHSPVTLFKRFARFRQYLQDQLHHDIIIETAPDYRSFLKRTQEGRYDFIYTAPHFALIAIDSGLYKACATPQQPRSAKILVREDSPITSVVQLTGKTIAIPPDNAIITLAGKHYLYTQGLRNKAVPVFTMKNSYNAAIHALLNKEAEAAIVSGSVTEDFIKQGSPLRLLAHSADLPGMAVLAAKRIPTALRKEWTKTIINMHQNTTGQKVLMDFNIKRYKRTGTNEFEAARPFINMYEKNNSTSTFN